MKRNEMKKTAYASGVMGEEITKKAEDSRLGKLVFFIRERLIKIAKMAPTKAKRCGVEEDEERSSRRNATRKKQKLT